MNGFSVHDFCMRWRPKHQAVSTKNETTIKIIQCNGIENEHQVKYEMNTICGLVSVTSTK